LVVVIVMTMVVFMALVTVIVLVTFLTRQVKALCRTKARLRELRPVIKSKVKSKYRAFPLSKVTDLALSFSESCFGSLQLPFPLPQSDEFRSTVSTGHLNLRVHGPPR